MKGFTLRINKECISGAINESITSINVTLGKKDQCDVSFGSMDKSGMLSYTWYAADIKEGDCLNISFEDIVSVSEAKETRDYNKSQKETKKGSLELYRRLKKS
jgi:hypothetical protein